MYYDETAATDVHGHARKQTLTTLPFVRTLEFGGSNGYWNGNHMTVQTEDYIGKEKEFNINISLRAYLHCAVNVCPAANKNTLRWKYSVHRPHPS